MAMEKIREKATKLGNPAARQLFLIYGALPLAYVIAGRLGLVLAVSPGYATAVFLPAGIAVGAAFMLGAASVPGTFLGSFLLNIWAGYSVHTVGTVNLGTAAAIISSASALQAGVGGALLRRVIGYSTLLDTLHDLLFFFVTFAVHLSHQRNDFKRRSVARWHTPVQRHCSELDDLVGRRHTRCSRRLANHGATGNERASVFDGSAGPIHSRTKHRALSQ